MTLTQTVSREYFTSMIDPKIIKVGEKKVLFFVSLGASPGDLKEIKIRGSSEITHKLNNDKTECFIQGSCEFTRSPCLWQQRNRNSCGGCSLLKWQFRHFSTRDVRPYRTSRPFCSSTWHILSAWHSLPYYHATWTALPSGLTFPLETSQNYRVASNFPSSAEHYVAPSEWKHLSFTHCNCS